MGESQIAQLISGHRSGSRVPGLVESDLSAARQDHFCHPAIALFRDRIKSDLASWHLFEKIIEVVAHEPEFPQIVLR